MSPTVTTETLKQITHLAAAWKRPGSPSPRLGWPTMPATPAGLTRTTSLPSSNAKSPPATPPAPGYASASSVGGGYPRRSLAG